MHVRFSLIAADPSPVAPAMVRPIGRGHQALIGIAPCVASPCPSNSLRRGGLRALRLHACRPEPPSLDTLIEYRIRYHLAPAIGLEPITYRLTGGLYRAERSAAADHREPA